MARGRGMKWAFWFQNSETGTKQENSMLHCSAHKRVMTEVPLRRPDWGQPARREETEVRVTSALKPYGFSCSVWAGARP